jgi:4-amino-4-deoxy-L-arabinose transferase-like glycosyltransferase
MRRPSSPIAESAVLAVALCGVFGVMYVVIARVALDGFPFSGDEYSVALQAQLFAKGLLQAPAPAHIEWLRLDHVVIDTFVRSKYPPGAPALLAIGARYGVAWIVTPIEGVLALALVWDTVRRLLGARPALVALVVVGAAPLYAYDAASFYTHTPTLLFLAIAFAAVAAWTRSRAPRDGSPRARCERADGWLVVVGMALGCAFLIRPVDALLFGAAMLVFRSPRAVIVPAAAALPFVIANLWYQNAVFGSPFSDGYHAFEPTYIQLYGAQSASHPLSWRHVVSATQWWNHIDIAGQMCLQWTVPGTVIAALFGAQAIGKDHPARAMRTFAIALVVVYLVALIPMVSDPDDGPHPRYLSTTLVPLALLAAAGFGPLCDAIRTRFGARVRTVIVVASLVFALAQLGSYLQDHIPKVWLREGLYQASAELPYGAIVIVRAQYPHRYARNGPFYDGVLYLSAPSKTTALEVAAAYPDRPIWEAYEGVPWTLVRVR